MPRRILIVDDELGCVPVNRPISPLILELCLEN